MLKLIVKIFAVILTIAGVLIFYYYGYSSEKEHHLNIDNNSENEKAEKINFRIMLIRQNYIAKARAIIQMNVYLLICLYPVAKIDYLNMI